jgi:hypothetical protein
MELSLYTDNLSHRTVCKMHTWMAEKVDPLQILSENVTALSSKILFYWKMEHAAFCTGVTIFLTVVPQAAISTICAHSDSNLMIAVIYSLKVWMHYLAWLFHNNFLKLYKLFVLILYNNECYEKETIFKHNCPNSSQTACTVQKFLFHKLHKC